MREQILTIIHGTVSVVMYDTVLDDESVEQATDELLQLFNESEWVRPSDRMPATGEIVQIIWHGHATVGMYESEYWKALQCMGTINDLAYDITPTFWKPLSSPPTTTP
ncbi:DUF551 domain-containing protein [Chitinophaga sp. HK235]|uniref:DUF551 domain-containing protein n=1 Tax=Chitinophaga sp. HK235 TaxID=2952571 RepID=UPI001BAAE140|nr:DUF551 domain-containing protein [Chitinophaga sp. HK235]